MHDDTRLKQYLLAIKHHLLYLISLSRHLFPSPLKLLVDCGFIPISESVYKPCLSVCVSHGVSRLLYAAHNKPSTRHLTASSLEI